MKNTNKPSTTRFRSSAWQRRLVALLLGVLLVGLLMTLVIVGLSLAGMTPAA